MTELEIKERMIDKLVDFLLENTSGYDCPEGYYSDKGSDRFFFDEEGVSCKPDWCSCHFRKCPWSGEIEVDCEASDVKQCWINHARDLVKREEYKNNEYKS